MWEVEYTDEFEEWWKTLNENEQDAIDRSVLLLENQGPSLSYPYSSDVKQSKHGSMRELRSQCKGHPLRTFYAFDPKRTAILLIGGNKTGNDDFYDNMVPKADKIFDEYLNEKQEEKQ
ncbi:MAG: type II toxin-antitoxin system RelE/ParE family toxin [Treponema sp.]|nr:type II toxin-antitoxin system RelE/ParE family toxin [Treponema sp.]